MVIGKGFGRGVCVCMWGGGGGGGGEEHSGGSDRHRASEERASASAVHGPPTHGQYIYRGIGEESISLFNQIQVLLLMTVYCVDLCMVFFTTRNCW